MIVILAHGHQADLAVGREGVGLNGVAGVGQKYCLKPQLECGGIEVGAQFTACDFGLQIGGILMPIADAFISASIWSSFWSKGEFISRCTCSVVYQWVMLGGGSV